jgi:hypothetical protein
LFYYGSQFFAFLSRRKLEGMRQVAETRAVAMVVGKRVCKNCRVVRSTPSLASLLADGATKVLRIRHFLRIITFGTNSALLLSTSLGDLGTEKAVAGRGFFQSFSGGHGAVRLAYPPKQLNRFPPNPLRFLSSPRKTGSPIPLGVPVLFFFALPSFHLLTTRSRGRRVLLRTSVLLRMSGPEVTTISPGPLREATPGGTPFPIHLADEHGIQPRLGQSSTPACSSGFVHWLSRDEVHSSSVHQPA